MYGILLNYAQLEVPEIHGWAEIFQLSTKFSNQPEPQQSQAPQVPATEPHSESPHHPLPSLVEQQTEIDRFTYVAQQWSTGEPCRVTIIMQVEVDPHATIVHQICHQFSSIITTIGNMTDRDSTGITIKTSGLNTIVGRNRIKGGIPTLCQTQVIIQHQ